MSSRDLRRVRRLLALTASAALALTGLVMITTTPSSAALPPQCVTAADGVSVTCTYTGSAGAGFPSLTIPNGTTSMTVHAVGRRGLSSSNGTPGGNPAVIDATVPTADGEAYLVQLRNDGGAAGTSSSGGTAGKGGGSSTLRKTTSSTPIIQAAGGGGAGNAGTGAPATVSSGGNAETAGAAASATGTPAQGGLPGGAAAGGDGGAGGVIDNCTTTVALASGNAGTSGNVAGGAGANGGFGGGGGGGGRFGGGGGGAGANGCTSSFGAGGGGGSSTVPAGATSGVSTTESAIVRITFTLAPRASISASSLAFGNVLLGTSSSEQTVTFTNTGSIPMTLGNGAISGPGASSYEKTADTCSSATLDVGSSCQVSVRFTPASVGDKTADFTIADNSPTSPHVISLTGTGIAPVATLSKTAIDFGNRLVGTTSTSSGFSIKNTGAGSLAIGTPTISGPNSADFAFAPGSNCAGATLAAGNTCQILVRFSPSATGSRSATVSIPTNAAGSPSTVALSGTGTAPAAGVTPTSIDFGVQQVGGTSDPQLVTLSNPGSADLHVTGLTITGTDAGDFSTSGDTCTGATVAPGSSCVVSVRFAPAAGGNHSATLSFTSDGGPATVSLAGIGLPPADLKVLGIGSVYTGRDHLVTRTVDSSGDTITYKLGVLNEDSVAHTYRIRLTQSGAAATAQVWASGFNAKVLPTDADGSFVTPSIGAGKVVLFQLKVTPTASGQVVAGVGVDLLTDTGLLIEGLDTETNTAAPTAGTSSYELFAKQGTQPYVGGPVDGQTATGPALNVGQSSIYTLRLKNDGTTAQQIGLKLTDVDSCAGSFTTTVKVGTKVWTTEAFAGTYLTPVLLPGKYTQVTVTVKRVATGCAAENLRVQSLDGGGGVVRTSYLLTNAAYNATTD